MTELQKNYDFKESEKKWLRFWEDNNIFSFNFSRDVVKKPVYSVDTPPPTVSGSMHLGHAFSYAQQDFNVRARRMLGFNVYFPFGTDDNGLPTERLVEKLKKVRSTSMERGEFISLCNETLREIKGNFVNDWKMLGMSCDFSNKVCYSTIDPYCVKTSQVSFIDLFEKKLVYQDEAPSMWCVNCQTAIAQAELEDQNLSSTFNDIYFSLVGVAPGDEKIIIATTRPELLPACVCIFVNPNDNRYTNLIGKKARVPIFNYEVPIFADESADPEKGSGILMICSYGDRFDVDAIKRHKLKPRVCIGKDGRLNEVAKEFAGKKIKEAREEILKKLDSLGLLKAKKDITHTVNVHDKCGCEIEFLSTKQWFVKVCEYKDAIKKYGDQINWYPDGMKARFDNWVENLNWDWCISRQRHFGVPIPVWYCNSCNAVVVAKEEDLPVDPTSQQPKASCACGSNSFRAEIDVFDTWMTSSVSPEIISNWVSDKSRADYNFNKFFPTSMRPQAHDIIRTWAFYTIVKAMHHFNDIPWKDIVISGHVLDTKGEKMSKSKGNTIAPQDVLDKYGADALRFWAAGSRLGEDLPFMEKDLITGQKTIVKLWNASKFAVSQLSDYNPNNEEEFSLTEFDKYMLKKFYHLCEECSEWFLNYEYSKVKSAVEKFFFTELCDNYLEIAKDRLYKPHIYGHAQRRSAQHTLYHLIYGCIKMFSPIMPFITEELYQVYFKQYDLNKSIHLTNWPFYDYENLDLLNEKLGDIVIKVVTDVRKYKTDNAMALNTPLEKIRVIAKVDKSLLLSVKDDILGATKAKEVEFDELSSHDIVDDVMVQI